MGAFRGLVDRRHWYRFESRIERSAEVALSLLRGSNSKATFFVLGWVADQMPELVRRIADEGHEVADRGYFHLPAATLEDAEFVDDVRRGREAVARASGRNVFGHRCCDWLQGDVGRKLDLLIDEGYRYDSSVRVVGRATAHRRRLAAPHVHTSTRGQLDELPVSCVTIGPLLLPAAGGAWLRHLPARAVADAESQASVMRRPFISCVHSWELDPEQPRLAAPWLTRLRHYRNLDRMTGLLQQLLERAPATPMASWLSLHSEHGAAVDGNRSSSRAARAGPTPAASVALVSATDAPSTSLSIVIPCYNEAPVLGYLERTLANLSAKLGPRYAVEYVFVDDGSSDATWTELQTRFGARRDCVLVAHGRNRGISAAIRTGVSAASSPVVASIDADCSYDPLILEQMVPLLGDGVSLVTASPYHPDGRVANVPRWRLLLSRGLSMLYRRVLHNRVYTITSCCRVYRRDVVLSVPTQYADYRGIAEWLVRIDLAGGAVVECPATLEARLLGASKMKIARSIGGHLRLLAKVAWRRLRGIKDILGGSPESTPLTVERSATRAAAHAAVVP